MSVKEVFIEKYRAMYRAMIKKDGAAFIHMTGMRQSKSAFIHAIQDGTLNYFSEELCEAETVKHENRVDFVGRSIGSAAVFGGGKHTRHLQLDMKYINAQNERLISEAAASAWNKPKKELL